MHIGVCRCLNPSRGSALGIGQMVVCPGALTQHRVIVTVPVMHNVVSVSSYVGDCIRSPSVGFGTGSPWRAAALRAHCVYLEHRRARNEDIVRSILLEFDPDATRCA